MESHGKRAPGRYVMVTAAVQYTRRHISYIVRTLDTPVPTPLSRHYLRIEGQVAPRHVLLGVMLQHSSAASLTQMETKIRVAQQGLQSSPERRRVTRRNQHPSFAIQHDF